MPYIEDNASVSAPLFDLIASMSGSEKRYFKLFASMQGGEKNYLKLFDFLDGADCYDEEEIRTRFSREPFIRQLHVAGNYLYNLILKALRLYHAGVSVDSKVVDAIRNAGILYEKGLASQCRKMLMKGKELAGRYELHLRMLEILELEDRWFPSPVNPPTDGEDLYSERKSLLAGLDNLYAYDRLSDEISRVLIGYGRPREENQQGAVEALFDDPLLQPDASPLTDEARMVCYYIRSARRYAEGDIEDAIHWTEKRRELMEGDPETILLHPYRYAAVLINLLVLCRSGYPERYRELMERFEELPERLRRLGFHSPLFSYWVLNNCYGIDAGQHIACGDFTGARSRIEDFRSLFRTHAGRRRAVDELRFNLLAAVVHFGLEEYEAALDGINNVLSVPAGTPRRHLRYTARLIELLVHFERRDTDLLHYRIQALTRFLRRRRHLFQTERILLNLLRGLTNAATPEEELALFRKAYDRLAPLRNDPLERHAFDEFNYPAWLRSRIDRIGFAEGVRRERIASCEPAPPRD